MQVTLAIALVLSLATAAVAETTLTVEDAVATALARNRGVQRDRIDREALLRSASDAWNALVPSVTLSAGVARSNELSTAGGSAADKVSVGATAAVALTFSPSAPAGIRVARLDSDAGQVAYESARRDLELTVRKAFYGILLQQENLGLAEQNIARAQVRYDQTADRHKAGLAPDLDLLTARVSLEKLRPKADGYRASLSNSLDSLKALLGLESDADLSLAGSLNVGTAEPAVAATAEGREGLRATQLRISLASARASKRVAELDCFAPVVSVGVSTEPALADPWSSSDWRDQGSVTLGMSLALDNYLPRSAARDRITAADDAVRKLESELSEAQADTRIKVRSAKRTIETALRSLEAQRLNAELAQQTYDLTQDAYRRGVKDLLDLESAAGDLESARVEVLSSSHDLITALLDLENALDLPFKSLWR